MECPSRCRLSIRQSCRRTYPEISRYTEQIQAYDERWMEMMGGAITPNVDIFLRLKKKGTQFLVSATGMQINSPKCVPCIHFWKKWMGSSSPAKSKLPNLIRGFPDIAGMCPATPEGLPADRRFTNEHHNSQENGFSNNLV